MNPHVKLIEIPNNLVKVIYTACKTCYSASTPLELYSKEVVPEKMLALIKSVMKSGHLSTIEHVQLTFTVSNVSRCCIQQLTRHRFLMFSQQSQRYVEEVPYILTPDSIMKNDVAREVYRKAVDEIETSYNKLISLGAEAEDARYLLPNGASTNLVISTNLRELVHVANLRLCKRAQAEIRQLIQAMCDEVTDKEPWLKEFFVPKCVATGKCTERKSCKTDA